MVFKQQNIIKNIIQKYHLKTFKNIFIIHANKCILKNVIKTFEKRFILNVLHNISI